MNALETKRGADIAEKELFWIENTTKRFRDGYNHFGKHPENASGSFDKHMK